jgi:hypothetical protein
MPMQVQFQQISRRKIMLKMTLSAAATIAMFAMAPAYASECDEATMMKVEADVKAMDPAMADQMAMAMKEFEMAKEAMTASKMDECKMHLDNAMKESMAK